MKPPKGILAPQYCNEDAAREHIEKLRWPDGPICPHCGLVDQATKLEPRAESRQPVRKGVWNCNGCRKQFTVTVASIFEDSHIPLHKWLLAIHLIGSSKKGISALQLKRDLDLGSYQTAWFMAHRIRWALTKDPAKGLFSGTVEIDETYIGGKLRVGSAVTKPGERPKDRPPAIQNKAAVVSVLQRDGSVCSSHVPKVTANTLRPIIKNLVASDAHLITDTSSILASIGSNFKHSQVNHTNDEYVRYEQGKCITTNTVEGFFALLKRGNYGVYHHWSQKYLSQYLLEFDWRYNVRKLNDTDRAALALKLTAGKRLRLKPPAK